MTSESMYIYVYFCFYFFPIIYLFSKNKLYIVSSAEALFFQLFYNWYDLWVCPVLLVRNTGYSVQCVVSWLMVYLYTRSQCSDCFGMIFESPLQFHVGITFKWCFVVLCDVVSLVLLLEVIVWLNSEIFSFGGCWCLWGSCNISFKSDILTMFASPFLPPTLGSMWYFISLATD